MTNTSNTILIFTTKTKQLYDLIFLIFSCSVIYLENNKLINLGTSLLIILLITIIFIRIIVAFNANIFFINNDKIQIKYLYLNELINKETIIKIDWGIDKNKINGYGVGLKNQNQSYYIIPQNPFKGIEIKTKNKNFIIFTNSEIEYNSLIEKLKELI